MCAIRYIDLDVKEIKEDAEEQKNRSSVDEEMDEHTRARLDLIERNKKLAAEKRRAESRRRKLFAQSQRSTREANKMILAFKAKERRKLRALQRKRQRLEQMQKDKAQHKNPYYKLELGWLSVTGKPKGRNIYGTRQLKGFVTEIKPQQNSAIRHRVFPSLISTGVGRSLPMFNKSASASTRRSAWSFPRV